jgi:hypothetical protein
MSILLLSRDRCSQSESMMNICFSSDAFILHSTIGNDNKGEKFHRMMELIQHIRIDFDFSWRLDSFDLVRLQRKSRRVKTNELRKMVDFKTFFIFSSDQTTTQKSSNSEYQAADLYDYTLYSHYDIEASIIKYRLPQPSAHDPLKADVSTQKK